jgi:ABC-type sugar transport systems, permease components
MKSLSQRNTVKSLIAASFILPSMIGFLVFYVAPTIQGFFLSFTDWDLLSKSNFIGLKNYVEIFSDKEFWNSLKVTLAYVLWNIPIQTALALCIAIIMDRVAKSMVMRGILLIPWILSNVVVALLWLWMLDSSIGIVNGLLGLAGVKPINFITKTQLALPSMAGINIWRHMGYTALLVFAGLQGVPKELEEAAMIDGAGPSRKFFSIIIPYIRPVLAFVIITSVIGSFQIYDTVAIITKGKGGPIDSTNVLNLYIYKNGFESYRMGYASAASMILFAILLGISFIQMKFMNANKADA